MNPTRKTIDAILDRINDQTFYSFHRKVFGDVDLETILAFFRRPLEDKTPFAKGITGFVPYGIENSGDPNAPDMIESYTLSSSPSEVLDNPLERTLRPRLDEIEAFSLDLSWQLLDGLSLEQDDIDQRFFDDASFLRLVYYPLRSSLPASGKQGMRHGEHMDGGFITLFPFGVSHGLQYLHHGEWMDVPPTDDTIVFAGKIMDVMTDGNLPGLQHRVHPDSNQGGERLTIQYFITANSLVTIPTLSRFSSAGVSVAASDYFSKYLLETMAFDSKPKLPVNFTSLAPYWPLYENEGMNTEVIADLETLITGSVLVIGSGQGLVSSLLSDRGYNVTNVDSCPEMAQYALTRRNIHTQVIDVTNYRLPKSYQTIVVNTGVINDGNVGTRELDELLQNIHSMAAEEAIVIFAHFWKDDWHDRAEELGIYGPPSTNTHFWVARGNIEEAQKMFEGSSRNPQRVVEIFSEYETEIAKQSQLIMSLGAMYQEVTGESPLDFISKQSGFYPFDLTRENGELLLSQLSKNRFNVQSQRSYNSGDTRAIITRT